MAIDSAQMGQGSAELGQALLKAFVFALTQQDRLPRTILFYNGGASLSCEGSPLLEDLRELEAQGVEIPTCGTCLNFYGLTDKLAVGSVTNMYSIVETLLAASSVIKPSSHLDNAATTLHKPPAVGQAMLRALSDAGNPGRGAHEPTLQAGRLVLAAREAVARLLDAPDPACIAFACNATAALNTALCGLLEPGDHVITTVCEHNSVLRPLYRLEQQGVQLSFVQTDAKARLRYEQFAQLLKPNTRAVVVTGASNVTGNLTDSGICFGFCPAAWAAAHSGCSAAGGCAALLGPKTGGGCVLLHRPQGAAGAPGHRWLVCAFWAAGAASGCGGSGVHSFDRSTPPRCLLRWKQEP